MLPSHLSDQKEPQQVAHDRDNQDQQFPPPSLPELLGKHVHGGGHQALHTDKLRARRVEE